MAKKKRIRPYHSLEEIQMRKEQLSEVIELENQEIKRLWEELTVKDEELSRGEQIAQFIKYGVMAYDGFMQVLSTEMPPFCGMDTQTVQFMLANMAMSFEEYDKAAKLVADLIVTPGVNRRIKDKCHDLKPVILAKIKESKNK